MLGLFPDVEYEDGDVDLRPGDLLVAFTDGVTEARNADGEEFGEERLKDLLRARCRGVGRGDLFDAGGSDAGLDCRRGAARRSDVRRRGGELNPEERTILDQDVDRRSGRSCSRAWRRCSSRLRSPRSPRLPPIGRLVSGLHVRQVGSRGPVIVFEAGLAATCLNWSRVQARADNACADLQL